MNTKKRSKAQEAKVARDLNGRPTIASGALYFQKADIRSDKYLCEAKYTDKDKYVLTLATWEKIRHEALRDHMRIPIMSIQLPDVTLAVIDLNDFYPLSVPPHTPKLVRTEQSKTRVAVYIGMIETDLDTMYTIPYSLALFEETHLVILSWSDFLMLNEEEE